MLNESLSLVILRKLWLCREDALLQQVGSLQEELASLQRSEHQLQQRALSLEAQLAAQQEAHQDLVQEVGAMRVTTLPPF